MACSSCNKGLQTNVTNKEISVDSLVNTSQDQLIDLYKQGYSIPTNTNTLTLTSSPKIQSMQGDAVVGLVELGLIIVGGYYVYKYCKKGK